MVGMGRGVSVGARRLSTVGEAVGLAVAGTGVNVGGIPAAVRVAAAVSAVALLARAGGSSAATCSVGKAARGTGPPVQPVSTTRIRLKPSKARQNFRRMIGIE